MFKGNIYVPQGISGCSAMLALLGMAREVCLHFPFLVIYVVSCKLGQYTSPEIWIINCPQLVSTFFEVCKLQDHISYMKQDFQSCRTSIDHHVGMKLSEHLHWLMLTIQEDTSGTVQGKQS